MHSSLSSVPFLYVVGIAYATILTAELVGDKTLYTVTSLALRFPKTIVIASMMIAFAAKMSVAVLLGNFFTRIPATWLTLVSAAAFLASAIFIWTEDEEAQVGPVTPGPISPRAIVVCVAALFIPEWGDPGQIAAAALTVQSGSAWGAWLGGTLALFTKGLLALTVGIRLRQRMPKRRLRIVASACCCTLAVVSLTGLVFAPG
jgi:putative Ca2+/H+ antiporter (TMEM165/GDT1 family)